MSLLTTVRTKRTGLMATAAGALLAGGFLTMPSAFAQSPNQDPKPSSPPFHVTICHHIGGKDAARWNPISPSSVGDLMGHVGPSHQWDLDIIPPFDYTDSSGQPQQFNGQNWTTIVLNTGLTGQEIFEDGCAVLETTPPTTPPVTTPPVTTPPVTTPPATTPPVTTPPATTPAVVPPVTNGTSPAVVPPAVVPGAVQPGAPGGQAMAGNAAPASVGVSAETSVSAAPADYTVPGLLLGSGTLLGAWLALTLWMKRRRGEHR